RPPRPRYPRPPLPCSRECGADLPQPPPRLLLLRSAALPLHARPLPLGFAGRGGGEAGALAERAKAVAEVLPHRAHDVAISTTAARGARAAPMLVRCRRAERRTSSAVW